MGEGLDAIQVSGVGEVLLDLVPADLKILVGEHCEADGDVEALAGKVGQPVGWVIRDVGWIAHGPNGTGSLSVHHWKARRQWSDRGPYRY